MVCHQHFLVSGHFVDHLQNPLRQNIDRNRCCSFSSMASKIDSLILMRTTMFMGRR